jgi:hypothetical protein
MGWYFCAKIKYTEYNPKTMASVYCIVSCKWFLDFEALLLFSEVWGRALVLITEYTEWQWPLSGVHSTIMIKLSQPGGGGGGGAADRL